MENDQPARPTRSDAAVERLPVDERARQAQGAPPADEHDRNEGPDRRFKRSIDCSSASSAPAWTGSRFR